MTFSTFKTMVAAFLQRDATSFVVGGFDYLSQAVNMASQASQRLRDFELCKTQATLSVSLANGASLDNAKLLSSPATTVKVKTIVKGFLPTQSGNYFPVHTITRAKHVNYLQRMADKYSITSDIRDWPVYSSLVFIVRDANMVYITPSNPDAFAADPVEVRFDIVRWLPVYSGANDTDFLLTDCTEYMLFKTVILLQPFLKEDVRVPLAKAQLDEAWHSVVAWDSQLVVAGHDLTELT